MLPPSVKVVSVSLPLIGQAVPCRGATVTCAYATEANLFDCFGSERNHFTMAADIFGSATNLLTISNVSATNVGPTLLKSPMLPAHR